jgi:hypothetical protein
VRQDWITIGYQVVAAGRVEEFPSYDGAFSCALRWIKVLVDNGSSIAEASASVEIVQLRKLDWQGGESDGR